jgi:hypothetical protein
MHISSAGVLDPIVALELREGCDDVKQQFAGDCRRINAFVKAL